MSEKSSIKITSRKILASLVSLMGVVYLYDAYTVFAEQGMSIGIRYYFVTGVIYGLLPLVAGIILFFFTAKQKASPHQRRIEKMIYIYAREHKGIIDVKTIATILSLPESDVLAEVERLSQGRAVQKIIEKNTPPTYIFTMFTYTDDN